MPHNSGSCYEKGHGALTLVKLGPNHEPLGMDTLQWEMIPFAFGVLTVGTLGKAGDQESGATSETHSLHLCDLEQVI